MRHPTRTVSHFQWSKLSLPTTGHLEQYHRASSDGALEGKVMPAVGNHSNTRGDWYAPFMTKSTESAKFGVVAQPRTRTRIFRSRTRTRAKTLIHMSRYRTTYRTQRQRIFHNRHPEHNSNRIPYASPEWAPPSETPARFYPAKKGWDFEFLVERF